MNDQFLEDQVTVFELILGFQEWLKRGYYKKDELFELQGALDYYIEKIAQICKRGGMGAKLSKNHLVLHVPTYMKLWGPPTGWDSGPNESHHKTEVKVPAKNTQRRQVSFLNQVSEQYDENLLIQKAECQFFGFKKHDFD